MKIINIPVLSRGPEVESFIGIFIILTITATMIFSAHSAYKNLTEIIEKNESYLERTSDVKNKQSERK